MTNDTRPVQDRTADLTDAEQAYLARYTAAAHPDVAEEALAALASYRRDHADQARLLLGDPS